MAILSKRMMNDVIRACWRTCGIRPRFVDMSGEAGHGARDVFEGIAGVRRRRSVALQESVSRGDTSVFAPLPGVVSWALALENMRMIHGGLIGGEALDADDADARRHACAYLSQHGFEPARAEEILDGMQSWPGAKVREAARALYDNFYAISGWKPELMKENRLKLMQQEQIQNAIEDQRRSGRPALYAFEKERLLLANIRAGDRAGARRILNEMLAAIYLSSPQLPVLRARAIELVTCLARAAIEDNPLLEPLIESNHAWTERLLRARSFEDLSTVLMEALDDFIEAIYVQGVNRSNLKVSQALDYIRRNCAQRISLRTVAREVGLSPSRLSHLMKQYTGRSVVRTIHEARVRHAQQLLERTAHSLAEIAVEVGFGDQSYFTKHFRRITGTTPARYRRARNALG